MGRFAVCWNKSRARTSLRQRPLSTESPESNVEGLLHRPLLHTSEFCSTATLFLGSMAGTCLGIWALSSHFGPVRDFTVVFAILLFLSTSSLVLSSVYIFWLSVYSCKCERSIRHLSLSSDNKLTTLVRYVFFWVLFCVVAGSAAHSLAGANWLLALSIAFMGAALPFVFFGASYFADYLEVNMNLVTDPHLCGHMLDDMTQKDLADLLSLAEAAGERENAILISRRLMYLQAQAEK